MKIILPSNHPIKSGILVILFITNVLILFEANAQIPIPSTYPANGEIYSWGFKINGTSWNTNQFIPLIYNRLPMRMLLPEGVTYNQSTNTFTNTTGEKFPLLIFLHGAGVYGTDNGYQLSVGGKEILDAFNSGALRGIVVFPQNSAASWSSALQTTIVGLTNRLISKNIVDPFAVSVTGTSAGGTAAWSLISSNPRVFASCLPMSASASTTSSSISAFVHLPIWLAQGAYDGISKAATANTLVNNIRNAGGNITYSYYADIGHGTWDKFLYEPGLYAFIMEANKVNPHVFFGRSEFCNTNGLSVKLGVTAGFEGYEWRKDGVVISTASSNEITVTTLGVYDVRIKQNGVWSYRSPKPVHIKIKPSTQTPPIQLASPSTTVIPDVNGKSNITLSLPAGYVSYAWKKNGSSATIGSSSKLLVSSPGEYFASVTELNGCTSLPSPLFKIINAVGEQAPYEVIGLTGEAISDTEVMLLWNDNPSTIRNETGFEIWRSNVNDLIYQFIGITGQDTTSFLDGGLNSNTTYRYVVRPVNQEGSAHPTEAVEVTTGIDPPPSAPTNLHVSGTTNNSVSIEWGASTDNQNVDRYEIYTNNKKSLITSNTSITVYNLKENQLYNFNVRAVDNRQNYSPFSNQITAVASPENSLPEPRPLPPVSLSASLMDDQAVIHWQDTSGFTINGYQIWRAHTTDSVYAPIGITGANVKTFVDGNIFNGTTFHYAVVTLAPNGESEFSGIVSITTDSIESPPPTPGNFVSTAISNSSIQLSFYIDSETTQSYNLYRSQGNNLNFLKIFVGTTGADSIGYIDEDLFSNVTYYYKVSAVNGGGQSTLSEESSAKTFNSIPILDSSEPKIIKWGTQLDVTLSAIDQDGETPFFTVQNLVNFATFTDQGNGHCLFTFNPAEPDTGTYKIIIYANDYNGGIATDTLLITVNNNTSPLIAPIGSHSLSEGATLSIPFSVSDIDSDSISMQFPNLPSFASFSINGNGVGNITLSPTYNDSGLHEITLEANDGKGGKSTAKFFVTVNNVKSNYRVLVNFTKSLLGGSPWNNTASSPTAGFTTSTFKDTDNASTSIRLTLITSWVSGSFTGESTGGSFPGIYPDNVMRSYYYTNSNIYKVIRFSGLDKNFRYKFTFFGSRAANSNYVTEYKIGNTTVSLNPVYNTTNTVSILDVSPNAAGEVEVSVKRASGAYYGFLNALEINAYIDDGRPPTQPTGLTIASASGNSIDLSWQDVAYSETSYDIYRSTNGSNFSKIGSVPTDISNFTDSNVSGKTSYHYKVASVNSYGNSDFSNVISVTTQNAIPSITMASTITVAEESISSVNLLAVDSDDATLNLSLSNNPSFISLTPSGAKSGILKIAPQEGDKGTYDILITVTDQVGATVSKDIAIVITDDDLTSVLINFNRTNNAPSPWNNTAALPTANLVRNNLKDTKNVSTGINMTMVSAWKGAATSGVSTGNNSGIYPDIVSNSSYYEPTTSAKQIRFSGLSSTKLYNFIFYGSQTGTGDKTTNYTTGGRTVSLNAANNSSKSVRIDGVKATGSGEILIQIQKGTNSGYANINAMEVESYIDTGIPETPSDLIVVDYTSSTLKLQWKDNSSSETGFEIWRSLTPTSEDFTLIRTMSAGTTTLTDSNLDMGATYFYKVRAITNNQSIYSQFSNVAGGSTIAFSIAINFNDFLNAPAPWNNLSNGLSIYSAPYYLKDNQGNETGVILSVLDNFNGTNNAGMNTGNNSGSFPDAVIRGSNYLECGAVGKLLLSGLNQTYGYHFTFFGSRQGTGDRTTIYSIDNQSASLNASNNTNVSVKINDVVPQPDGTIVVNIIAPTSSAYSYINAMMIQTYPLGGVTKSGGGGNFRSSTTTPETVSKNNIEQSQQEGRWVAFPNPFDKILIVKSPETITGQVQFELIEMSGKKIRDWNIPFFESDSTSLDLSDIGISSGLYILKIADQTMGYIIIRVAKQ